MEVGGKEEEMEGGSEMIGVEGIIRKGARVVFMDSSPETVRRHAPLISLCSSLARIMSCWSVTLPWECGVNFQNCFK